jgi:hypothetical protein
MGFPDKLSRSPPSRPDPVRIANLEYGSVFGSPQARLVSPDVPRRGPIPDPGDLTKVKQFWRI